MLTPIELPEERDPRTLAIGLALIVAGLAGLQLARMSESTEDEGTNESSMETRIGLVRRLKGGVRYRPGGAMLWRDFHEEKIDVHEGDLIFTDSGGKARLELKNGVSAEILP